MHSKYDAVLDAGTPEHVFNVPAAFKNVMDALKVGGHFFGTLSANKKEQAGASHITKSGGIPIRGIRLDTYLTDKGLDRVDLLKLDIEG